MGNIHNHLYSLEAAPDHKYSFVSNRNEEPSDSHNDSGIDEFSSPLSPGTTSPLLCTWMMSMTAILVPYLATRQVHMLQVPQV